MQLNITFDPPSKPEEVKPEVENAQKRKIEESTESSKSKIPKTSNTTSLNTTKNPADMKISRKNHPKTKSEKEKIIRGFSKPFQVHKSEHIYSTGKFSDLGLNESLCEFIQNSEGLNLTVPTLVQQRGIPVIMTGNDVLIKSETGSGKTLTYLLPVIQKLLEIKIKRNDGSYCIILCPTRELCVQIYDVLAKFIHKYHWIVAGIISGGEKKKSEKNRIRKGLNIIISTPGRLLDHLDSTYSLNIKPLKFLILDEADRLLDMGFKKQIDEILKRIKDKLNESNDNNIMSLSQLEEEEKEEKEENDEYDIEKEKEIKMGEKEDEKEEEGRKQYQTILCSATLSDDIIKLASSLLTNPKTVSISNDSTLNVLKDRYMLPEQLIQHVVCVPVKFRLFTLMAFVHQYIGNENNKKDYKIIIFFSTIDSVEFHYNLFHCLEWPGIPDSNIVNNKMLLRLHGNINQAERMEIYHDFINTKCGVLFCTDVAARGLDLPKVDWIVQYDPPSEISEYVHRAGRTARAGKCGSSLLFLAPGEMDYCKLLEKRDIKLTPIDMDSFLQNQVIKPSSLPSQTQSKKGGANKKESKNPIQYLSAVDAAVTLQNKILEKVESSEEIKNQAIKAFTTWVKSYATHNKEEKLIFHIRNLHLGHVAKSFGLKENPQKISEMSKPKEMMKKKRLGKNQRKEIRESQSANNSKDNGGFVVSSARDEYKRQKVQQIMNVSEFV